MITEDFNDVLNYDPFLAAEKMTGDRYDSEEAKYLGAALFMGHARVKREELGLRMDTYSRMEFSQALSVFSENGFQTVLEETFPETNHGLSKQVTMWRNGVLLFMSSIEGFQENPATGDWDVPTEYVNSARFYYNWVPHDVKTARRYTSSGHFDVFRDGVALSLAQRSAPSDVWVWGGHHDGREAAIHHLSQLEDKGTLLETWNTDPSLHLIHFSEEKHDEPKKPGWPSGRHLITQGRLQRLPYKVQNHIAVAMREL